MIIMPAIDLYDGQCVRLEQGDFNRLKVYNTDPLSMALWFAKEGAAIIHVVDLEAAKTGELKQFELITQMAQTLPIPIQVGGGIRSLDAAKAYLEAGVDRVVIGTLALEQPDVLAQLVKDYQDRIVVSLDVKDERVMIKGWQAQSQQNLFDVVKDLETMGVKDILVTDIATDGMLEGTNVTLYQKLQQATNINVIASGGVKDIEDIKTLTQQHTYAVIVGKAIYESKLSLKEALRCSQGVSSPV